MLITIGAAWLLVSIALALGFGRAVALRDRRG